MNITSLTEKFNTLKALGFTTVKSTQVKRSEIPNLFAQWQEEREEDDIDSDGIVLSVDNVEQMQAFGYSNDKKKCPKGQIALKWSADSVASRIKSVEWSMEGGTYITCVGIIDPVELDGATIQRVSLKSLKYIKANNVGIGTEVEICRSGQVIPKVLSIISNPENQKPVEPPLVCPICGFNVDSISEANAFCVNEVCPAKEAARILKFLVVLGVKGLGHVSLLEYSKMGISLLDFVSRDFDGISNKILNNPNISKKVWSKIQDQLKS